MACDCVVNLTPEERGRLASCGLQAAGKPPISQNLVGVLHIIFEEPERVAR
jgi:hypothetical protein